MKNFIVRICAFLFFAPIFANPDLSPWLVIHNATKLDMEINTTGKCYLGDNPEKNLGFDFGDNENIDIYCSFEQDENEKNYLELQIVVDCAPESTTTINRMLLCNQTPCDLAIQSITCTNHCLQLQTFCNFSNEDLPHVTVDYQPDYGISIDAQQISTEPSYADKLKKMIQNTVLAILQAMRLLPY